MWFEITVLALLLSISIYLHRVVRLIETSKGGPL